MIIHVDGSPVHLATGGLDLHHPDRTNEPLVLLVHGAGMDSSVWFLQTRWLGHRSMRAAAVDLPSHGRSGGDPFTTIEDGAAWLARVVETLDMGPAVVVGHSMGTFLALSLAARRPELVSGTVLFGTADAMGVHPELLDAAANDVPRAAALMTGWSLDAEAKVGSNPTPGLWMAAGAQALVEISQPGVLSIDLQMCAAHTNALSDASCVTCPTTVVMGRSDKMTPVRAGQKLTEALASETIESITLQGVGHMMMTEDPATVRTIIRNAVQ